MRSQELVAASSVLRPLVLEGGSVDVNGQGMMITTEECLLSDVQQRNPGISREDLEMAFHDFLGVDKVIWLNRGIAGDDTHGHVDDIAAMVAFVAGPEAAYVTGANLTVDGGTNA